MTGKATARQNSNSNGNENGRRSRKARHRRAVCCLDLRSSGVEMHQYGAPRERSPERPTETHRRADGQCPATGRVLCGLCAAWRSFFLGRTLPLAEIGHPSQNDSFCRKASSWAHRGLYGPVLTIFREKVVKTPERSSGYKAPMRALLTVLQKRQKR